MGRKKHDQWEITGDQDTKKILKKIAPTTKKKPPPTTKKAPPTEEKVPPTEKIPTLTICFNEALKRHFLKTESKEQTRKSEQPAELCKDKEIEDSLSKTTKMPTATQIEDKKDKVKKIDVDKTAEDKEKKACETINKGQNMQSGKKVKSKLDTNTKNMTDKVTIKNITESKNTEGNENAIYEDTEERSYEDVKEECFPKIKFSGLSKKNVGRFEFPQTNPQTFPTLKVVPCPFSSSCRFFFSTDVQFPVSVTDAVTNHLKKKHGWKFSKQGEVTDWNFPEQESDVEIDENIMCLVPTSVESDSGLQPCRNCITCGIKGHTLASKRKVVLSNGLRRDINSINVCFEKALEKFRKIKDSSLLCGFKKETTKKISDPCGKFIPDCKTVHCKDREPAYYKRLENIIKKVKIEFINQLPDDYFILLKTLPSIKKEDFIINTHDFIVDTHDCIIDTHDVILIDEVCNTDIEIVPSISEVPEASSKETIQPSQPMPEFISSSCTVVNRQNEQKVQLVRYNVCYMKNTDLSKEFSFFVYRNDEFVSWKNPFHQFEVAYYTRNLTHDNSELKTTMENFFGGVDIHNGNQTAAQNVKQTEEQNEWDLRRAILKDKDFCTFSSPSDIISVCYKPDSNLKYFFDTIGMSTEEALANFNIFDGKKYPELLNKNILRKKVSDNGPPLKYSVPLCEEWGVRHKKENIFNSPWEGKLMRAAYDDDTFLKSLLCPDDQIDEMMDISQDNQ